MTMVGSLTEEVKLGGNAVGKDIKLLEEYPVANTFIQFSAPRSTSLEKFLAKREAQSCPASRMVSVDEEEPVERWPATRGPSLEEDANEKPAPQSRMASVDEEPAQWPATRGPSLEEESRCHASTTIPLQQDCIQFPASWAAVPMQSSGECRMEAPLNADDMVWDPSQWQIEMPINQSQFEPALQDVSGGVPADTDFVLEPVSRLAPWPVNWEPFLQPVATLPDSQSDFIFGTDIVSAPSETQQCSTQLGQLAFCPTSQNLAKWDAMNEMSKTRDPLLERFMTNKNISAGSSAACDDSTAASSVDGEAVRELLLPKGMFEDTPQNSEPDVSPTRMQPQVLNELVHLTSAPDDTCYELDDMTDKSGSLKINLTYSLGMWSIGSAKHATGDCKPCGFLWKKGCHKAQNCQFCHLCGSDEVKRRKRDKIEARRREEQLMWECGEGEQAMPHETPRVLPGLPQ
eukprot:gnl/MRDRNA2_/MRDRNA2_93113_c0_seq1.p1 gnl/MRDRNA2_/MRDRNA2_93113_c0~~gnl/MRDRNA2_/MRDRNA2_93113_c0_seq1.p1  ORF type:complete len:459 (-),score=98.35 gnl/MRDRNA2_/MRDRNA2_93113_c0_seq1:277-1653(-)